MEAIIRSKAFLLLTVALVACVENSTKVTYTSNSPSGRYRVEILENVHSMDRNFRLFLTDTHSNNIPKLLFISPDESRPPSERAIWSKKEDSFLLVSSNVLVDSSLRIFSGENLYLLYNLNTARLWCNAAQSERDRFTSADVERFRIQVSEEVR